MAAQTGLGSTPGVYQQTGILTTVTAQLTTQVNPFPGTLSSQSVVTQQQVAVTGPIYQSPGGILNKGSGLTTGGGP
jgi:hypothetical protein